MFTGASGEGLVPGEDLRPRDLREGLREDLPRDGEDRARGLQSRGRAREDDGEPGDDSHGDGVHRDRRYDGGKNEDERWNQAVSIRRKQASIVGNIDSPFEFYRFDLLSIDCSGHCSPARIILSCVRHS